MTRRHRFTGLTLNGISAALTSFKARSRAFLRHPYSQVSYAQEGEDLILDRIFHDVDRGYYVDVGAHHPWRFSNTFLFYKKGWSGINIEPNPEAWPLFASHRGRDVNLPVAISDVCGNLNYYMFDEPALNTFDQRLAEARLATTPYRVIDTREVAVRRLDQVLAENLPPEQHINFLSVDVEGLDLEVLRSSDWIKYRPDVVLAESLGSDLEEIANSDVFKFMRAERYRLFAKTYNTLFFIENSEGRRR